MKTLTARDLLDRAEHAASRGYTYTHVLSGGKRSKFDYSITSRFETQTFALIAISRSDGATLSFEDATLSEVDEFLSAGVGQRPEVIMCIIIRRFACRKTI